jgi:WD40 repeat protein
MSDVFISYSRRDQGFVEKLHYAIEDNGRETWVDWQNILPTAQWWTEIQRGIEGADTFVFVLSPDSITSRVCEQEIDHAVQHHKRIVPIVYREGFEFKPTSNAHQVLSQHNWLSFAASNCFESVFQRLLETMDTDLEEVRLHTRLLVRSIEWESNARNDSFLLRGDDLDMAEQWLAEPNHRLPPTQQQQTYIQKSREVETANQRILSAGKRAKRLVQLGSIFLLGTIAFAGWAGWQSWRSQQVNQINSKSVEALRRFETAQLPSLLDAVDQGRQLQQLAPNAHRAGDYPTTRPIFTLRSMLGQIREQNQLKANAAGVYSIAFSPDSRLIATGGRGNVQISTIAGKKQASFRLPSEYGLVTLRFDRQGKEVLVLWEDSSIGRWDLAGKQLSWKAQKIPIQIGLFSPDRQSFATARKDGSVQLWSIAGKSKAILQPKPQLRQNKLSVVNFSPDGKFLVTAGEDGSINWWNQQGKILPANYPRLRSYRTTGNISDLAIARNKMAVSADGTIWIKTLSGANIQRFIGDLAVLSPDGQHLVAGSNDGMIEFWDLSKSLPEFRSAHEETLAALSISPNGRYIASAGVGQVVRLWDLSPRTDGEKASERELLGMSVTPDDEIALGGKDGKASIWNFAKERQVPLKFTSSKFIVWSVATSPNGQTIATGDGQGMVRLWNRQGKELGKFRADSGRILNLKFSPNGEQIATAADSGVRLWSRSGQLQQELEKSETVYDLSFRSDGEQLAATFKGTVKLWDKAGKFVRSLNVSQTDVSSVRFSSDQDRLVTAGKDGFVRLWTSTSDKPYSEFKAHPNAIYGLSISPDGQQILTSSASGITRLWTLSGEQLGEWRGNKAAFNRDGQMIITVDEKGMLRVIENETLDRLLTRACNWLQDYLTSNPMVSDRERQLCDRATP